MQQLIIRIARENRSWAMIGLLGPRQSWTQCLRSDGQQCAAPSRSTAGAGTQTYDHQAEFIRTHLALLAATDFLTVEVLTLRGLVTYYVLFFIHLVSRRVDIAGITPHPDESWMEQIARNVTMDGWGILCDCRYLLHDRDTKYRASFLAIMTSGHVKTLRLPARSPNLNAFSERWIRSVKEEYLSKVILFGENSLRRAMREYVTHYHAERNHQGKSNTLLFPRATEARGDGPVECRERLGGLLLPPRRRVNW